MNLHSIINKLSYAVWPTACLSCQEITSGEAVCHFCFQEFPWNSISCSQCGLPWDTSINTTRCGTCITHPPAFEMTLAPFLYHPPITQFITQLKFHRQLHYAHFFGTMLAERIATPLPQYLIPVPLHPRRLRQRGFNQAVEIAKPLAKRLHIPVALNACYRSKNTAPQTELPAKQRHTNVKNAFTINPLFHAEHVAIIDDVITTGSTVRELSLLLLKHHVSKIDIWCCARAAIAATV
ncbi:MAG: hypothetical protein A3F41_02290 [Coxiella sp. RIFCSPHIGHO2_12_FULL_44_14]|nr:MAG: hypothetical protein A3F41_02290 [Coxiella sp. RIFCSPHIGHO2_12_FULL_44_14]